MQTYREFLDKLDQEEEGEALSPNKVGTIITSLNKTLALKNGRWTLPVDYIRILEDPKVACVRICKEKIGIELQLTKLKPVTAKLMDCGNKLYLYEYECRKEEISHFNLNELYSDSKWVTSYNIPKGFPVQYKTYIN